MLAPADSRLGALQRGRGDGFRWALQDGSAVEVTACVVADPRWDRQIENREEYYAELLHRLGADLAPLASRLREIEEEPDAWLPVGVLAELARRGEPQAAPLLVGTLANPRLLRTAFYALLGVGGEELVQQVVGRREVESLVACASSEDLSETAQQAPAWAGQFPELRRLLAVEQPEPGFHVPVGWIGPLLRIPQASQLDASAPTEELLSLTGSHIPRDLVRILRPRQDRATLDLMLRTAREGDPRQRGVAFRLLGEWGCADLLGEVEQVVVAADAGALRFACGLYVAALPPTLTLPLARRWFHEARPLNLAGEAVLERHAQEEDREMLERALEAALRDGIDGVYRLCSIVEALGTVGNPASRPLLATVYHETGYSWARRRAIQALPAGDPLLVEALWDCEEESRGIACAGASLRQPGVLERLRELRDDQYQERDVRESARLRSKALG